MGASPGFCFKKTLDFFRVPEFRMQCKAKNEIFICTFSKFSQILIISLLKQTSLFKDGFGGLPLPSGNNAEKAKVARKGVEYSFVGFFSRVGQ